MTHIKIYNISITTNSSLVPLSKQYLPPRANHFSEL